jgi:hypothetical protein
MKKLLTGALAALTLSTALVSGGAAASAGDWGRHGGYGGYGYRGGHGHGWGGNAGSVIGAGILGLAVGAAISDHGHDRYYDGRRAPNYDYGPPPAYYSGASYYSYMDECRVAWRWDPYWRRYVEVERCY